jgi:tryptophan-rich sensory protein
MGTAAGISWSERTTFSWVLTGMFFSQLGLNVLWSFCFFYLQSPIFGFAALIILILFLLVYVSGCYMQKPLAAYLNIPYLAWLLFAAYLNGYVMFNN